MQCVHWHIYIYKLIKGHGPERRSVYVAEGRGGGWEGAPTHINDGESFDREHCGKVNNKEVEQMKSYQLLCFGHAAVCFEGKNLDL